MKRQSTQSTRRRTIENRRERGSVLAVSTLGMLAFLLATGLCVDISHLYLVKTELQNAADASALAAVSALNGSDKGIIAAKARAEQVMNNYGFNKTGVRMAQGTVEFAVNLNSGYMNESAARAQAANIRFVRVRTPQSPTNIFFASILLGGSRNLTAESTAGMSVPLNVICDWIPLSVIDYGVAMKPGQTYTIRAAPSSHVSPGNYQVLAVAGRGGRDVREGLASGVDICAEPGQVYNIDTKPGVNSGPVKAGINTRFDEYQGAIVNPTDHPPDTNIKENINHDTYIKKLSVQPPSAGHTGVDGRRIVYIPIVKLSEYDEGRGTVKFDRFGAFFLQTKVSSGNGGDIVAEYIDEAVVGGRGGYNPNGAVPENTIVRPVLYR
jgi:Flp pilus assembly protein TadG